MLSCLSSNPMVRGLAALYASTFFSGAWAMIIPTIPVLSQQFEVSAGAVDPFLVYAPFLVVLATLLAIVGKETGK